MRCRTALSAASEQVALAEASVPDLQFTLAERKRKSRLRSAPNGSALHALLSVPLTPRTRTLRETSILATDFETGGLNPEQDELLSIGCVALERAQIKFGGSSHTLLTPKRDIPAQSVRFHKITDTEAGSGSAPEDALKQLLGLLQGKVLLAHHARTEIGFLFRLCDQLYGLRPVIPVLDTLAICSNAPPDHPLRRTSNRRLFTLRDAVGLPRYPAHHAFYDALSTAELLLAHCSYLPKGHDTSLKTLQMKYVS